MTHDVIEWIAIGGGWYGTWAYHAARDRWRHRRGTLGEMLPSMLRFRG
jgi:hypothetical protein